MKDLFLSEVDRDLDLSGLDFRLTENSTEYVSQTIETVLRRFKGEWWLNEDIGLPFYTDILVKNPNINVVNTLFKTEIKRVNGVKKILNFSSEFDTALRELSISFEVLLTNGDIIKNEVEL